MEENKQIFSDDSNSPSNNHSAKSQKQKHSKFSREWKRKYLPLICSFAAAFVISVSLIFVFPTTQKIAPEQEQQQQLEQSSDGWPTKVLAPFMDTTYWVPTTSSYSIGGVADIGKIAKETDLRYFNLAFINPSTTDAVADDGTINWCWGGYDTISKQNPSNGQYQGILAAIKNVRDLGGDITISVGGQLGKAPWVVSNSEQKLYEMYKDIIETYSITRLDLDIEESNQGEYENQINAKAIKRIQDETNVKIILTIPIMPDGWKEKQLKVINAYLDAGVDITLINSMTMCYGYGVYDSEDYGDASIRAMESANKQLIELYKQRGITLSEAEAYKKMGATVSLGYESLLYPTFTPAMASKVATHAKQKSYGMLSFWSVGRDAKLQENKGVSQKHEFLDQMYQYLG